MTDPNHEAIPDAGPDKVSPWAGFLRPDFFLLWSSGVATTVSMLLRTLISTQWLYETTGSAAQLGLLGVVQFVQLPMALYGGSLADRLDRKNLMVLTQAVGSLLLAMLTLLAATHTLLPWHIFAATGFSSMAATLGSSARPAMLPRVVPRSLLTHAITTLNVSSQLATVAGPILFWGLYEQLGLTTSFGVSTGISLVSVVLPLLIRTSGKPERTALQSTWTSLKEGTLFVMRHPLLPGVFFLDLGVTVVSSTGSSSPYSPTSSTGSVPQAPDSSTLLMPWVVFLGPWLSSTPGSSPGRGSSSSGQPWCMPSSSSPSASTRASPSDSPLSVSLA
jgi:MFS family permease